MTLPLSYSRRLRRFLRSVVAQAFLLPANGETERGVKTIDKARNVEVSCAP